MPTRSYLSQSELPVTIGLDDATQPEEVEIVWPRGTHQKLESVPVDRPATITEPQ
jgi:hypothetical protein